MKEMLSWSRYVAFDEDPTPLVLARNDKINEVKKKREQQRKQNEDDDESDDYMDLQDVFKGQNIKPLSPVNEIKAWQLISNVAQQAYNLYP